MIGAKLKSTTNFTYGVKGKEMSYPKHSIFLIVDKFFRRNNTSNEEYYLLVYIGDDKVLKNTFTAIRVMDIEEQYILFEHPLIHE